MKIVIQRVKKASLTIEKNSPKKIGKGLVLLIGFEKGDTEESLRPFIQKLGNLRIFEDQNRKMNFSIEDIQGEYLIAPNFTLAADLAKGNRPSFDNALAPKEAKILYKKFRDLLKERNPNILSGDFGASMQIDITNDGPVTFILKSES